jgi:hypothetical protein
LVFAIAPFAFGAFRAISARYDLRMLWMALASCVGALAIRGIARRQPSQAPSTTIAILTLVVTTLLAGITAMLLGATAPAGVWLVALVVAICWTVSYYFDARSRTA